MADTYEIYNMSHTGEEIDAAVDKANAAVPQTRTVNGKALSADVTLSAEDVGALVKTDLLDYVYPVGSIYMSVNSTSPASFLGGTWELIEDRFIRGADSNHAAGTTGGSWTHTQTKEEVGPHAHGITGSTSTTANAYAGGYLISNAETYDYWILGMETINSNGAQPMDITNPYFCAYIWKRTA